MPNYVRAFRPGGTFFLTLVTERRAPLFAEAGTRALLRGAIARCQLFHPFSIDAVVLLPDHLHLLMTIPEGDADFSVRVAHLKTRFTRDYLASGGAEQSEQRGGYTHPACLAVRRGEEMRMTNGEGRMMKQFTRCQSSQGPLQRTEPCGTRSSFAARRFRPLKRTLRIIYTPGASAADPCQKLTSYSIKPSCGPSLKLTTNLRPGKSRASLICQMSFSTRPR